MNKELSDKTQAALAELMDSFLEQYHPAESWETADVYMTSAEVMEMFGSVYPIPLDKIYENLREEGFNCVPLPGRTSFVWLLTLNKK